MRSVLRIVDSVLIGAVISATIVTAALLLAMFSTQGDNQRTEVLFGGLFFQTAPTFGGVTATMGVGNPGPLVITFLVAAAFGFLVQAVYFALKRRRDLLHVANSPT